MNIIKLVKSNIKMVIDRIVKLIKFHKAVAAVTAGVMVMTMLMSVVVVKSNDVEIYVDGELVSTFTTFKTDSADWIELGGINVAASDKVTVDNCTVHIERSFFVTVEADGGSTTVKTLSCTVAEAFEKIGIEVSDSDVLSHSLETVLTADTKISVTRVTTDTVTESKIVKHTTKKIKSSDLYEGQTKVKTEGVDGEVEYVYSVTYTDGVETSRELISETTITKTVEEVILVGTKVKSSFKKTSSTPTSYKKVIAMNATAYTYGEDGGNVTVLGEATRRGIVAVDPSVIPLGTKLYIESADGKYIYGEAVAGDIGGAIKGNRIDIFVESAKECYNFGRRVVNVYILD